MTAYEIACAAHNEALAVYRAASDAYYAGRIGDAEFSTARVTKRAADVAFDVAFEIASNLPEEVAEVAEDNTQADLFA
jgi:hypothetical protein